MLPPGMKSAGAYDIAARCGFGHHRIQHGSIVVVIGWKHEHEWRFARCKSGEYGPVGATSAITDEYNRERVECVAIAIDRGKRVVVFAIVADQYPV